MCPQLICIIGFGRLEARHALVITNEMDNFEFAKIISGNSLTFSSLNMNVTKPL